MNLPTFGIWRRKRPEVIKYWYTPIDQGSFSTNEFYSQIEGWLQERKFPGIEVTREEFSEGGALSPLRQYLRIRRERLVFDVCSAPFGEAWFFSARQAQIPVSLMIWELLLILAVVAAVAFGYIQLFGLIAGSAIILFSLMGGFVLMRNALTLGLHDLDAFFLRIPVFGTLYELVRKETYHRFDTRVMFLDQTEALVKRAIEETTAAGGFKQVEFKEAYPEAHPALASLLRRLER
ncbi:MAG: hypothetical protein OJI67_06390 [Prosthecobacter sp.]|nr:hypothetical protein [Prosthecobacter sp.]